MLSNAPFTNSACAATPRRWGYKNYVWDDGVIGQVQRVHRLENVERDQKGVFFRHQIFPMVGCGFYSYFVYKFEPRDSWYTRTYRELLERCLVTSRSTLEPTQ